MRIEVSGLEEVRQALARGGRVAADKCKDVLSQKADQALSMARPMVPIEPEDGGQLLASLRKGRPTYIEGRGVVSVAVIAGGAPLESVVRQTGHRYNIYAVLQEMDIGKGAPYRHSHGEGHFLQRPVETVAPTIPAALYDVLTSADLGGA